jgi:hypothetical protein
MTPFGGKTLAWDGTGLPASDPGRRRRESWTLLRILTRHLLRIIWLLLLDLWLTLSPWTWGAILTALWWGAVQLVTLALGAWTLRSALCGALGCLLGFGLGAGVCRALLWHHARGDRARRDGGSGGGGITGRDQRGH